MPKNVNVKNPEIPLPIPTMYGKRLIVQCILRLRPELYTELREWAKREGRSMNMHMNYLLEKALAEEKDALNIAESLPYIGSSRRDA